MSVLYHPSPRDSHTEPDSDHTKVRNRFTNVRVEKLVGIRANLRLFEPDTEPSSTRLDSDTEEEDSELDVDEAQEEPID
ncbi:hypothetical protein NQZ68_028744 [Dissostichus eleginoides]|nr:hypothetical protein NQZ68_028744 [Dissostichus eleginoides]